MMMLEINSLSVSFKDNPGMQSAAESEVLHGVSLKMAEGERIGLVGESGCGKTTLALAVAGLLQRSRTTADGEVNFFGRNLLKIPRNELRKLQGRDICMIFQEPMSSLNPLVRVGRQVEETLKIHTALPASERKRLALEVMGHVELPDPMKTYYKYPHELSGGQRQRAMIASAFISDPKLLIADEPTTALDVSVQEQIITLLKRINAEKGVGILFISHDLNVVRKLCERVAVMYRGKIVEEGPAERIFESPSDEYTKRLIAAMPKRKRL